ncbi:MAG: hypothetical protein IPN40_11605 [Uliginosibacterium sp.]|nr:hypothetical protein [Uliginosibacterium sp.]
MSYDFSAGNTPAPKNGWSFDSPGWAVLPVPGTAAKGMEFTYPAARPGEYMTSEHRFTMPPSNNLWLKFRLHIPQNYEHRFDTLVHIPAASIQNWKKGDQVRAADGSTIGIISGVVLATYGEVPSTGIFLRNPPSAWDNGVWVGTLHNITRNEAAVSTVRQMWGTNNKLLSLWTDGYSSKGLGSSMALEFWPKDAPAGTTSTGSDLAVHYSSGNYTVMGGHMGYTTFITSADRGKYIDVMVHAKLSTSAGAKNGVLETWLRREGQAKYTQIHNITDANMDPRPRGTHPEANWVGSPTDLQPWQRGYLMGWSNSAYDNTTTFFISRVEYFQQLPAELK